MISVTEAEQIISNSAGEVQIETLPLQESYGRVLQENIIADRNYPEEARSTMDGICVRSQAILNEKRTTFKILGTHKAGDPAPELSQPGQCWEIMTGAVLPKGADAVIPVEQVKIDSGEASILSDYQIKRSQCVHQQAADYQKGEVLLNPGCVLHAPQIAICGAVGKSTVKVAAPVNIAIIGTGDEIVEIDQPVFPHQVRQSNAYAVEAALRTHNFCRTKRFHIPDDYARIVREMASIMKEFSVVIVSGGVSAGKFDFIPRALEELGVEKLFHKVSQRPGKPFWFGTGADKQTIFALPGNPISTLVCTCRYVVPYLQKRHGLTVPGVWIELAQEASVNNDLTNFVPVRLLRQPRQPVRAAPIRMLNSGAYVSLAETDGFIEMPAGSSCVPAGGFVRYFSWGGANGF